ncbi:Uncharacterised protein [uncultured archaeon]|nr:Uncharacterised protein [uncultured archaeon]
MISPRAAFVPGPTVRKIALAAVAPFFILFAASALGLGAEASTLAVVGFFAGMVFPDIDVLTGFIRTTFQTMVLIVLMGFAILLFPVFWPMAQGVCPAAAISGFIPGLDASAVCQIGLAIAMMAAAYVLSWILVAWIPDKNAFHHWTSAAVMMGGVGMLNHIIRISDNPWPLSAGFGIGYALHLLADFPPSLPFLRNPLDARQK